MEKKIYDICCEVLRRMDDEDLLDKLMIVGSWCIPIYRNYFSDNAFLPPIRTRDLDFLLPQPFKYEGHTDLFELFKDLGFVIVHKGQQGFITLQHPDLILEFIAPARGRERDEPVSIKQLGINAQSLRYMDILLMHPIRLRFEGVKIVVPHPASFAFHKLLIADRRKKANKREKDHAQACAVLEAMIGANKLDEMSQIYGSLKSSWQTKIVRELADDDRLTKRLPFLSTQA